MGYARAGRRGRGIVRGKWLARLGLEFAIFFSRYNFFDNVEREGYFVADVRENYFSFKVCTCARASFWRLRRAKDS